MAGRPPRANGNAYAAAPAPVSRTNEYFVPRDGIDREVITADICRYLGNDALVRPGTYTDEKTGQVTQGYYITAYRNLTSPMITDLKNDSARWEAERRRQSGAGAVAGTLRPFLRTREAENDDMSPDLTSPVRYQDSAIRDSTGRPIGGGGNGGGNANYGGMPPAPAPAPYYPSSEAPGYNAANIPPPGPAAYGPPGGYSQPPPAAVYTTPMHPSIPDPRYNGQPAGPTAGLGAGGYGNGGNGGSMAAPEGYAAGSYFQASSGRDMYAQEMAMDDAPPMPVRRTSPQNANFGGNPGANFRGGYSNMSGGAGSYGGYVAPPPAGPGAIYAQPVDNNYGRAPNMPNPGFNTAHDVPVQQPQQYDDPAFLSQSLPGPVATSPKTQLPSPSGPSPGPRRDRLGNDRPDYRDRGVDRLPDRDPRDPRDPRPPREPTPPNRTGSASKNGNPPHHYNRR